MWGSLLADSSCGNFKSFHCKWCPLVSQTSISHTEKREPHMKAAFEKFGNHLWYVSQKLVCVSLYDNDLSCDEKRKIADAVLTKDGPGDAPPRAPARTKGSVASLSLSDYPSRDSMKFFRILGISSNFLPIDPADWCTDAGNLKGREIVKQAGCRQ